MTEDLNPQAAQMAHESMVRNLASQALAIWPQEAPLLRRYALPAAARILDAGCGTGEASARLAEEFPSATVLGVDVLDAHLERARERARSLGDRVRFENRSVYALGLPERSFDLTVCRHVLQAIPRADEAIAELARVTRPGGRLHLIAEDYGMVYFPRRRLDARWFWSEVPVRFGRAIGTDMFVGRRAPSILARLGLESISVEYLVVDTLRVPRRVFAAIWEAWRDGYSDVLASHVDLSAADVRAHFEDQIATILDPASYAAWLVPVVSGRVPA
ncbi:MAG TPA: class I SAM-dependent methyltransferase [Anaeromyxobacteraceae bacterium]|nr:class I SAM-dependent methyltransferase [Anaeromyxobacteraceae bacterium]